MSETVYQSCPTQFIDGNGIDYASLIFPSNLSIKLPIYNWKSEVTNKTHTLTNINTIDYFALQWSNSSNPLIGSPSILYTLGSVFTYDSVSVLVLVVAFLLTSRRDQITWLHLTEADVHGISKNVTPKVFPILTENNLTCVGFLNVSGNPINPKAWTQYYFPDRGGRRVQALFLLLPLRPAHQRHRDGKLHMLCNKPGIEIYKFEHKLVTQNSKQQRLSNWVNNWSTIYELGKNTSYLQH